GLRSTTKPLHESHGSALRAHDPAVLAGPASERAKHGLDKNVYDLAHQTRVIGQVVTQCKWKREHPLPDGHFGQHAIYQMRRSVRHPAAATARAEAPALARKWNNPILSTGIAVNAQEAVCGNTTLQKQSKFALDEPGNGMVPFPLPGQESPDSQRPPHRGCFLRHCGDGRRAQNHKQKGPGPAERNRRSGTLPQYKGKDIKDMGAPLAADLLRLASRKRSNGPEWRSEEHTSEL